MDVRVGEMIVELGFWDTANGNGEGDYDRYRPLSYPDSGIIVICFSVDDPKSLENVTARWYPEVAHFAQGVPILLLGCKTDLRPPQEGEEGADSSVKKRVSHVRRKQGEAVARAIGAVRYLECSALMNQGVHEFLQASAEIAGSRDPHPHHRRHTSCQIL
jgi:Ras homolog gene family, member A